MDEIIGGTVIQRSFVSREANMVLHAVSVPLTELGTRRETIENVLVELLGIPREAILDEEQYSRILKQLPPSRFARRRRRLEDRENTRREFLADSLSLGTNGLSQQIYPPWMPLEPGFEELFELNSSSAATSTALRCVAARLSRVRETDRFIAQVLEYDIPTGQSPTVGSESLLKLLETSGKVCVAPLAAGGMQAVANLAAGNYAAALLAATAGGGVTLILISTVSLATLLVQMVERARLRGGGGDS